MISNFKAPDLNAPRYREKVLSLLNSDLIKEFKHKYPAYSKIDNSKLKNIIKLVIIKKMKIKSIKDR